MIISLGMLIKILIIDPYLLSQSHNEAKNLYYKDLSVKNRFDSLLKLNNEIKGWIFLSNTHIDYPVVQSTSDPEFYLYHNYKKEPSRYGSIFIDSGCKLGTDSKNMIIHGHHMRDGEMFADILKLADIEFYKQNPVIEFDTPAESANWKIISVFKTNTLAEHGPVFNYTLSEFASSKSFMNFVSEIKARSLIETHIDVNEDDKLITLSTCSYEFKDFRTVVVARKVRDGESRMVDIENARMATNPVVPECACAHKKIIMGGI